MFGPQGDACDDFAKRVHRRSEQPRIKELVDGLLAEYPDELKVTPGQMVYEIQPKLDWDKAEGIGIFVGDPDDPDLACRPTAGDFVLASIGEVDRFLRGLAR